VTGQPARYIVRYEGAHRDDAEYQFELDRPRHALDGYVPTHIEWIKREWSVWTRIAETYKSRLRALVPGHRAVFRTWLDAPATLVVTYVRDDDLAGN
jgi:hypothetical protein